MLGFLKAQSWADFAPSERWLHPDEQALMKRSGGRDLGGLDASRDAEGLLSLYLDVEALKLASPFVMERLFVLAILRVLIELMHGALPSSPAVHRHSVRVAVVWYPQQI